MLIKNVYQIVETGDIFNADGTMQKVTPTLRGVGFAKAMQPIEIDRYSAVSETGASIAFIDSSGVFQRWKTIFNKQSAWVKYNKVDFNGKKLKKIKVNALSASVGTLQICLKNPGAATHNPQSSGAPEFTRYRLV